MSGSDIDQGTRWSSEIATQLEQANIGIICLTPDNVLSPSLHFEAGALSKALDKSRVCTYLLDLAPTDLRWPLADFQATRANRDETKKLLIAINKALGEQSLPVERLGKTFERWWPELEAQIAKLPHPVTLLKAAGPTGNCSKRSWNSSAVAGSTSGLKSQLRSSGRPLTVCT